MYNVNYSFARATKETTKKQTFLEVVSAYMARQQNRVKASTLKSYPQKARRLKAYIKPALCPCDVNQLFIEDYTNFLHREGLKINTVNRHVKFIKQVLHYWQKLNPKNICQSIEMPKDTATKPRPLNKAELHRLKNEMVLPSLEPYKDYFLLLIETGMHFSDGFQIKNTMVTPDLIKKQRQKTKVEAILIFTDTAKQILEKYNYTFPNWSNGHFNKMLKILAENVGIRPDLRASDARDTFADYWGNEKGISFDDLAVMMGLSTTKEIKKYLQIREKRILNLKKQFL